MFFKKRNDFGGHLMVSHLMQSAIHTAGATRRVDADKEDPSFLQSDLTIFNFWSVGVRGCN
jgi:hypothetical protein